MISYLDYRLDFGTVCHHELKANHIIPCVESSYHIYALYNLTSPTHNINTTENQQVEKDVNLELRYGKLRKEV